MTEINAVIFDFDGTIADSFTLLLDIADHLLDIDEELTEERIQSLRGMSQNEVLNELGVNKFKALWYYRQGKEEFAERLSEVNVFLGLTDQLESLSEDYMLGILTNNDKSIVDDFLQRHELRGLFSFVEDNSIFESKAGTLRRLIRERCGEDVETVVYVGDQVTDVEAAQAVGYPVIAVTWGYKSQSYLQEANPDVVLQDSSGLVTAVQSL